MSKPPRLRRERRKHERDLRKSVRVTERLAAQLPGATLDAAIDVPASALVEIQARATPCPQCGGALELRHDRAQATPRGVLREVQMICRQCHAPRTLWFRVAPTAMN